MRKFEPETKLILRAKKVSKQKISPKKSSRKELNLQMCAVCLYINRCLITVYGMEHSVS